MSSIYPPLNRGATASAAGAPGLVRPAAAGQQDYNYTGAGTWVAPPSALLFSRYADAGNVNTDETTLYSDSIPATALSANGAAVVAEYGLDIVGSATATRQVKIKFGTTASETTIFDSTALTFSSGGDLRYTVLLVRVSASVVRYVVTESGSGATLMAPVAVGEVTGLTLANAQTLLITGQAAGAGAATNDIVAKLARAYVGNDNGASLANKLNLTGDNIGANAATFRTALSLLSAQEVQTRVQLKADRGRAISDGATTNRAEILTPGTIGAVAGLPMSILAEVDVPTSNPSATAFVALVNSSIVGPQAHSLQVYIDTSGALAVRAEGATNGSDYRLLTYAGFRSTYSGQTGRLEIKFPEGNTTTNPTILWGGVDITSSFTASPAGTPPNWMDAGLVSTYFLAGYNWPAGDVPYVLAIVGALSTAESQNWGRTGRLPAWATRWGHGGNWVRSGLGHSYGSTDASVSTDAYTLRGSLSVEAGARTGGSGSYFVRNTSSDSGSSAVWLTCPAFSAGDKFEIRDLWIRASYAGTFSISLSDRNGSGTLKSNTISQAVDANTWTQVTGVLVATGTEITAPSIRILDTSATTALETIDVDDLALVIYGPIDLPSYPGAAGLSADAFGRFARTLTGMTAFAPFSRVGDRMPIPGTWLASEISSLASTTVAGTLPPDWGVVDVQVEVLTALSDSRTLDLGTSGSSARWMSALAVSTTGFKAAASLITVPSSNSVGTTMYWKKSGSTTAGQLIRTRIIIERKY